MKKDWFGAFLPFWMFGTIGWLVIGFTLMPEAFRRPLFRDNKEVWVNPKRRGRGTSRHACI